MILNWKPGRQGTGYLKLLLKQGSFYDMYLLKFPEGSEVPEHTDPIWGIQHLRLNLVLRHAKDGGKFQCQHTLLNTSRIKLFRPDEQKHSVTPIKKGSRLVLSIGFGFPFINHAR